MTEDPRQYTTPPDNDAHSISVFFPCYNESGSIENLVKKTVDVLEKLTDDYEIIIVDDGSTDQTPQIADRLSAEMDRLRVIHHQVNSGYGAALQSGFNAATKQLIFYTDGDAQFDIAELADVLPMIQKCDIVSCYRIDRSEGSVRKLIAWCWGKLVCFLFDMDIRDIDCAFKLYKRSVFDNVKMKSTGALIDTEILARAARKGYTIAQHGVRHYPRTAGRQTGVKLSVIFRAFRELFKLRKDILRDQ